MIKSVKIYLCQLTHEENGFSQNWVFPLGAGYVGAAIKKHFQDLVEVEIFKSPTDLNNKILLQKPDIVMFGCYMWNTRLSEVFALSIRDLYPDIPIIFGGPNISTDQNVRLNYLRDHPYVDAWITAAAEIPSIKLIESFIQTPTVHTIRNFKDQDIVNLGDKPNVIPFNTKSRLDSRLPEEELDCIPSPYLLGLMDKFFIDGEIPLIETNRGCPFRCAFCQQGEDYFSKVINFSLDRVLAELQYIADRISSLNVKINSLEIADANFGMYKRDKTICEFMRTLQDKYNYPKSIGCSTGKNKPEVILDNIGVLKTGSLILRSAIQSMDPDTLKTIRRDNIKLSAYKSIQQDMALKGLDNCADLMLGLPNETYQAHINGIFELIDFGIKEFSCLQTIVLKGTTFETQNYRSSHGIKTLTRPVSECSGNYPVLGKTFKVMEVEDVITETNSLSHQDYLNARKVHLIVMLYHNSRLLSPIYSYLDNIQIPHSTVIREILKSKNSEFNNLLDMFIKETMDELSEINKSIFAEESISDNKIFKFFSIGFFSKKTTLLNVLRTALTDILGECNSVEIEELASIADSMMFTPSNMSNKSIHIKSLSLRRIFGSSLNFEISPFQQETIELFISKFGYDDNALSKLSYRLRPNNMTLPVG